MYPTNTLHNLINLFANLTTTFSAQITEIIKNQVCNCIVITSQFRVI